jgi:putative transposase
LSASYPVSVVRVCGLIGLHRSTHYYQGQEPDDGPLRVALQEAAKKRQRWGYRRLIVLLRREGWRDNPKRIFRVYREEGLQVVGRKLKAAKWRREKPVEPFCVNQRRSMDFVHDLTQEGRRIRLLNVEDD